MKDISAVEMDAGKWLLDQLLRKKEKNPSFSLRAFARQLGVSPALLSQVTRGHKVISERLAQRVVERLRLTEEETHAFLAVVNESRRAFLARNPGQQFRNAVARKLEGTLSQDDLLKAQEMVGSFLDNFHSAFQAPTGDRPFTLKIELVLPDEPAGDH